MKVLRILMLYLLPAGMLMAQENNEIIYSLNNAKIEKKVADLNQKFAYIPEDFNLFLDKNQVLIHSEQIPLQNKILYQKRLLNFIDRATSKELFQNGKYTQILNYNLLLIKWSEENTLLDNVRNFPVFSLQAIALFADDTAAYHLVDQFANELPDEVLRKASDFSNQWYFTVILRKVFHTAPYTVKLYFTSGSAISDFLKNDMTLPVIYSRQIFFKLPFRTKAFMLLDPIYKEQVSLKNADSICQNRDAFLSLAVKVMSSKNPVGRFSLNNELSYICETMARDVSMSESISTTITSKQIMALSKEELLALLIYGYKDLLTIDFDNLISILQRKPEAANRFFLENVSTKNFAGLIKYAQKREMLEQLVKACGEKNADIIRPLLSHEEPDYYLIPNLIELATDPTIDRYKVVNKNIKTESDSLSPEIITSEIVRKESKAEELIREKAAEKIEEVITPVSFDFTDDDKESIKLKQNVFKTLQNIPAILDKPYAKDILLYAATLEPDEVLKKVEQFKTKYFCTEILTTASLKAPVSLKRYLANPNHVVYILLRKSENEYIKKMFEINIATGFKTKTYLLINQIVKNQLSVDDAIAVVSDKEKLFKEMVKTISDENPVGTYSIERELEIYSLRYIRDINDKINIVDNIRFAALDTLSPLELYYITVYGREEVFNSTFNGIFSKLESKFDFRSFKTFEKLMKLPKFSLFISLCASYNKLDKLLGGLNKAEKEKIISHFVSQLYRTNNSIESAVTISEAIANITNPEILFLIQKQIKKDYESCEAANNTQCIASYGILAGLCKDKAVYDPAWFNLMAKKYPAGNLATLKIESLQQNGKIIERMFFYDDDDGSESYVSFLSVFKNNPNWQIDEYFNYTKISSTNGIPISIFANKPSFEESGDQAIKKIFSDNQWEPSILIHRGHSFHTQKSLENLPDKTKLLFVGSCGGFYKATSALKNATDAQIIATKQIGTKLINDPILFAINDELRKGIDIQWPTFWNKIKVQLGGYSLFHDYVPPHKNIEALFQNAYYKTLGL
jgi:hypothetical protein